LKALLDKVLEVEKLLYSCILDEMGEYLDCVQFWGDLGIQQGPLMRPSFYREIIKPREKELIRFVKSKSKAKIAWHSCGSCQEFIPDLIEIGVDLLNPVQVNAANMEPAVLKQKFGNRISFWGGIDGQKLLPFSTPEKIRSEVRKMINTLAKDDGGYLVAACHNIQNDVPGENVIALFDESFKSGKV